MTFNLNRLCLLISACVTLMFCACKKNRTEDSLSGRDVLSGKLSISDEIFHVKSIANTKAEVYLYTSESANGFLYKKTADTGGNFFLDFLHRNDNYRLSARVKIGNADYVVDTVFKPADYIKNQRPYDSFNRYLDTVGFVLRPDLSRSNYVRFVTIENTSGDLITGVSIYLYTSRLQFNTRKADQAAVIATTKADGQVLLENPAPGKYYLYAERIVGTDTLRLIDTPYYVQPFRYTLDTLRF